MNKTGRIAKKTIKYIRFLQKHGIEFLQDEDGSLIDISKDNNVTKVMINCWQNKPIEILLDGKETIFYKNKYYSLLQGKELKKGNNE